MPPRFITPLLIILGFAAPAAARDLFVEVDVLHLNGSLTQAELATMLASPRLTIEAHYQPTRLIVGETARRERVMPIGSKLFAIPQQTDLRGEQIERKGMALRFRVSETHPAHDTYRLQSLDLRVPIAAGPVPSQGDLHVGLMDPVPKSGAHDRPVFWRQVDFALGLRLRLRWSDTPVTVAATDPIICRPDIQSLGNGQYRFRPEHTATGFFRAMPDAADAKRAKLAFIEKQLQPPYPQALTGWTLENNKLTQVNIAGQNLERISISAKQSGRGECRRSQYWEVLFANGQPVTVRHSRDDQECESNSASGSRSSIEAHWLDNGSLARYMTNDAKGDTTWDAFDLSDPRCNYSTAPAPAPSATVIDALKTELQGLRAAFVQVGK